MLKRIITSVVGVALFIPVLWFSDTYALVAIMAFLCLVGNFELMRCIGIYKNYAIAIPQYIIALITPVFSRLGRENTAWIKFIVFIQVIYILYLLSVAVFSHGKTKIHDITTTFAICTYINVGFSSIILLRDYEEIGKYIFLLVFVGAWMTDIFAYFTGLAFGKHKLIPDVSPKKTIEGSVGGIIFCAFAYVIYAIIVNNNFSIDVNIVAIGIFGVIISIVSQIGDLAASLIKREYGIKDYGKLFPGHGGVLDRFDSVLAVASVLMVLVYSFGI